MSFKASGPWRPTTAHWGASYSTAFYLHREAYLKTFDRLGLRYEIVDALTGAMGGSASEEFLAPTPVGEDAFVQCTSCGYAANAEAVQIAAAKPVDATGAPAAHVEDTPDTPTIATLVDLLNTRDDLTRDDRPWLRPGVSSRCGAATPSSASPLDRLPPRGCFGVREKR